MTNACTHRPADIVDCPVCAGAELAEAIKARLAQLEFGEPADVFAATTTTAYAAARAESCGFSSGGGGSAAGAETVARGAGGGTSSPVDAVSTVRGPKTRVAVAAASAITAAASVTPMIAQVRRLDARASPSWSAAAAVATLRGTAGLADDATSAGARVLDGALACAATLGRAAPPRGRARAMT